MNNLSQTYERSNVTSIENNNESIKQTLKGLEADLAKNSKNIDVASNIENIIKDYKLDMELNNKLLEAIRTKDYKAQLNAEITKDEKLLNDFGKINFTSPENPEIARKRILKNQYLLEHEIKPIFESASTQGFNALKLLIRNLFPFLMSLIIIIMCSDTVSKEFDDGTYKLMFAQPIKKWRIVLYKLFATYLSILLLVGSSVLMYS